MGERLDGSRRLPLLRRAFAVDYPRPHGAWISQLTALEPYRPIFIGVMLVFLGLAFRQLYIVPAHCALDEACANSRLQRRQRQIFWVVVVGLAALIAFPWYAPLLLS